jgi:hypothetical protein
MHHQQNPLVSLVVLAVFAYMMIQLRRGRQLSEGQGLPKGQRLRPIVITWLDPIVSILVIGSVFYDLLSRNVAHVLAAMLGAAVAIPIGLARAHTQYVRAVPSARAVVFRRSGLEYGLLGLLLGLRLAESAIERSHDTALTLLLTALISLAVVEPVARTAGITAKYLRDRAREGVASDEGPAPLAEDAT